MRLAFMVICGIVTVCGNSNRHLNTLYTYIRYDDGIEPAGALKGEFAIIFGACANTGAALSL
jgi:hypothetical protein